jgi:putative flippase GtrA
VFVGTVAAAVHLGVVALLVNVGHLPPLLANVPGFLVAFFVSFGGHARWTFPTPSHERGSARRRFFVLALTSFVLNQASYAWALHWAGERWYLPALGFVLVAVSVVTFILAKVWAFAPQRSSRPHS